MRLPLDPAARKRSSPQHHCQAERFQFAPVKMVPGPADGFVCRKGVAYYVAGWTSGTGPRTRCTLPDYDISILKIKHNYHIFKGIARKFGRRKAELVPGPLQGSLAVIQRTDQIFWWREHAATAGFSAAAESSPTLPGIPGHTHFCPGSSSGVKPN